MLVQDDALAHDLLEPAAEPPLVLGQERHRRAHPGPRLAEILVDEPPVRGDDLREMVHAAALGHERGEVPDQPARAALLRDRRGDGAAVDRLDPRPREHVARLRMRGEGLLERLQLRARRGRRPRLPRRREEGLGIALGRDLAGAHLSSRSACA